MAKIAFDVKYRQQIESGQYKVETRDGRPARIICWDRAPKDTQEKTLRIVALVTEKGGDAVYCYHTNGQKWGPHYCGFDLFIITPEPELTEFEKKVAYWMETAKDGPITNEMIVGAADNLMFCARQQIIKEAEEKAANEGYGIEDAVAFNEGFKTAKEIYSKAAAKTKRLPTIEEWKCLIDNCKWEWDDKYKGQVVTARNGNSIFLPAAGYRDGTYLNDAGSDGYYWSSSPITYFPYDAYYVNFNSDYVNWSNDGRYYGFSVRPVSDTPMEGFVDMGDGLYWAEKNVEGYYNYDEAMKLFEK